MSLLDQNLRFLARADPSRIVTQCGNRHRTAFELEKRVSHLAAALHGHLQLQAGDLVALCALNTDYFLETLLAVVRAGLIAVLVNWRWSRSEAAEALNICKPKLLIIDSSNSSFIHLEDTVRSIRSVLSIGASDHPLNDTVLAEPIAAQETQPTYSFSEASVDQPAVICFTSGSTGPVKGVALSQAALHAQSEAKIARLGYSASDVYLHTAPLFHVGGLSSMLAMLHAGAQHIFTPKFSAAQAVSDIQQHRVTALIAVPTALHDMIRIAASRKFTCPSVRKLLIGGGSIRVALEQSSAGLFPNAHITLAYGMTETASSAVFQDLPLPRNSHHTASHTEHTCVGLPAPGWTVGVCPIDGLRDQHSPGTVLGEVLIKGPGMLLGYWDNVQANAAAFVADGSFRTGDIGYVDSQKRLWLAGRLKKLIRSGSESVQAAHVEAALEACPGVVSAAVVGLPDERLGQIVAALIVVLAEQHSDAKAASFDNEQLAALQQHCLTHGLSRFQLPRFAAQQHQPLPVTALGKISGPAVQSLLQRLRDEHAAVRSRL